VQREHARARRFADLIEVPDQALEIERLTVLVPSQMRVRVDDNSVGRQERA
jgi:hypothetical protein